MEELLRSKIELSEGKEMHAKFSSGNLWGLRFFLPPLFFLLLLLPLLLLFIPCFVSISSTELGGGLG